MPLYARQQNFRFRINVEVMSKYEKIACFCWFSTVLQPNSQFERKRDKDFKKLWKYFWPKFLRCFFAVTWNFAVLRALNQTSPEGLKQMSLVRLCMIWVGTFFWRERNFELMSMGNTESLWGVLKWTFLFLVFLPGYKNHSWHCTFEICLSYPPGQSNTILFLL